MKSIHLETVENPQKMISYWKKEWRVVMLIIFMGIVFNASMSMGPILQGRIIDSLIMGSKTAQVLWPIIWFVITISAIQFARFMKRYYVRIFANRTGAVIRKTVYRNIINRDITSLNGEKTGDLMTKAISDVDACVEGMRKFTTELFDTGVLMLSYFITMLYYGVELTLCACALIPVAMILAEKLKKIIFKYTKEYRVQLSEVSQITYETVENTILYRICGAEEINLKRYNVELEKLEKKALLANIFENSMQPVYNVIVISGLIAIVYFGGKNVINAIWSVGEFSAYLSIFFAMTLKASKAAKLFNSVQKAQISWKRIKPYLTDVKLNDKFCFPKVANMKLDVDKMSFIYPNSSKTALKDITFTAKTGEIIGITGLVASGKSTIGLALLGLYSYDGSILMNGKELREFSSSEISRNIAYMGHDSQLLSDTIYRNITLGDDGDVISVLKDVCFDKDLEEMPSGIETMVGSSGVRLSGGQQSRLALARALYRKSQILVLDDPFSAVDMKTEKQIIYNLKNHYNDRAIILISHRISIFDFASSVVLVDGGCAVCSTHEKLLETSEIYRSIATLQQDGEKYV